MQKSYCENLPYPMLKGNVKDLYSASIIYPAFISAHSELNAVVQYVYHDLTSKKDFDEQSSELFMGIAMCEMKHFHILGETLVRLGAEKLFSGCSQYLKPFFGTGERLYSTNLSKMLMDDISGELIGIENYEKMLDKLKNEEVSAIIMRIILDEKLHTRLLKERLEGL